MTIQKVIILLLTIMLSLRGLGQNQSSEKILIINVTPQTGIIKFSEIFKDYSIYRLKSDKQHFLKTVTRVIPIEDKLVIGASSDKSRVHIFHKSGEYITNVGLVGRGPTEYLSVRSFKVYPSLNRIEVLDYNKNSILRFSLENGKFQNELKIVGEIYPDDFEIIDNNYYFLFEKIPLSSKNVPGNRIKLYSVQEEKEVFGFFPVDLILSKYLFFGELTNLYQYNKSICFFTSFNDTIYSLSNKQKNVRYIFDLGKYQIKKNILYGDYKEVIEFGAKCTESLCIWDINTLLETQNGVFFRFRYGDDFYYSFYNKTTNHTVSSNRFNDDLVLNKIGTSTEMIKPIGKGDNCLYFRLETPFFLKAIDILKNTLTPQDWTKYCNTHRQVIDIYNSIDINENDLILELKLKD